jgi:hypothetical protein
LELCVVSRQPAKPKPAAEWQISRIAKVARVIGTVQASDADTAIRRAIEKFEVPPEQRDRIMARPITERA